MDRSISLQAAIDEIKEIYEWHDNVTKERIIEHFKRLPSVQPEITLESAIDYLHSIGWMQEHDRILTESAQPEEDCDTCKHGYFGDACCNNCKARFPSHYERRTDE